MDRTAVIVCSVFLLVGLGLLAGGGRWYRSQARILNTWPQTDAEVVRSEVTSHRDSKNRTMYSFHCEFRYAVDGNPSSGIWELGYSTSSHSSMATRARKYAPGSHHTIRYNPDDPQDIRAEAGYTAGFFMGPIILGSLGGAFTLIAGIVLLVMARAARALTCPMCGERVQPNQNFCPHCAAPLGNASMAAASGDS